MPETNSLRRTIGLPLLTLYGLGTILGAGIYVLIGEVVTVAGTSAPSAFLVAAILAGFTAFSFAELGSRVPKSAGEAAYVDTAFGQPVLTTCIGWAVVTVGTVSAATMVRGFIGYLEVFVLLPPALVLIALVTTLTAIAIWGIAESLLAAAVVTGVEIAGLVLVCTIAADALNQPAAQWRSLLPGLTSAELVGVVSGAFLAFYAFIGFEDIVNVAEEVKGPERTLPRAIVISLLVSTALYLAVAVIAVFAIPREQLADNGAPLAAIVEARGYDPGIIAAISLLAVINGALVQIIMVSRVLYGLAGGGLAPAILGRVNRRTRTPLTGTIAVGLTILLLSMFFSLGGLAQFTSLIALGIFTLVNASLWKLKKASAARPPFCIPLFVPVIGTLLCAAMIFFRAYRLL